MQFKSRSIRSTSARPAAAVFAALFLLAGACGNAGNADTAAPPTPEPAATTTVAAPAPNQELPSPTEPPEPTSTSAAPEPEPTTTAAAANTLPPVEYPLNLTTASGASLTIEARPERIISLSPTHTEMLFAIGAGSQVVAVDEYSYYPPEAPVTDLSGFTPNVEAVVGYQPDLVVVSYTPADLAEGMEAVGVGMLEFPAAEDISDVYDQILLLGEATDNTSGAAELVGSMQSRFAELLEEIEEVDPDLEATYYHELDSTFYSVTSDTFIGSVYALAGLRSIADEAEDAGGYPQLSAEFILEADPDLIFVTSSTPADALAEIAERPGWSGLTALQEERVVILPPDIASRWGPRIVDFFEFVADALADMS